MTQVQDPSQNGYRTTRIELASVRDLDVAVLVPEELRSRVRPSVGAWACSYSNESASWVAVFADVTALVLLIEWVYSNNTWKAYNNNFFLRLPTGGQNYPENFTDNEWALICMSSAYSDRPL